MPENQSSEEPADQEGDAGEGTPKRGSGRDLLQLIWIYHPLALLALALALAGLAYSMLPAQVKQKPKPLADFYNESLQALRKVKNPMVDATAEDVQKDIQEAKVSLEHVFTHKNYREQLESDPALINPYLLFGDSLYLYGNHPLISQERDKTFQQATWAYTEALKWEEKRWSEREQRIYDQQFFHEKEPFDERTLAARKLLRKQYEQYMRSLCALKAGQYTQAAEDMESLLNDFRTENLGNSADDPLKQLLPTLPPHEFEILPEDRTLLYFYLGQLYENRGDIKEAERYYQIFLLHAKRSREYFIAMMRLGAFYFEDARSVHHSDPAKSRRLYRETADIFTQVVAASPPGDLLREAYFTGGRAFLNIALLMPVGEKTIWNTAEDAGAGLEGWLVGFTAGNALPERTRAIIPALGRLLTQAGLSEPVPPGLLGGLLPGQTLSLSVQERQTPMSERNGMLRRAKAFFTGAQGGEDKKFDGASYVMLARTYMAEGDFDKSRGLLRYTRSKFWGRDVDIACQFWVANSYLQQKDYDRALVRFVGGVEKLTPSLVVEYDVKSWNGLCQKLYAGSRETGVSPGKRIWGLLPDNVQEIIRKAAMTDRLPERFQAVLVNSLNNLLDKENFYESASFQNLNLPRAAHTLLEQEIPLLTLQNRQWLNRMLLDASLGVETLSKVDEGESFRSFPPKAEVAALNSPILISDDMIIETLIALARAYTEQAGKDEAAYHATLENKQEIPEEDLRLLAAAPRRSLADASQANSYLLANYPPANKGEIMMENAGILKRRAHMAANPPFRDLKQARDLISEAADAYMKIGFSGDYLDLEPEALLESGAGFFAAGQYGRATEALARFASIHHKTAEIGWARNLLGRCYWLQGRYKPALGTYRENSRRLTPDGWESLYYLGAVSLDARQLPDGNTGKFIDLLGNPKEPFAKENKDGQVEPDTALQIFNEVRRTPGLTPSSQPWRWATFGLGKTWYEIAEQTRQTEIDRAQAAGEEPMAIAWLAQYETAIGVLREGLERYRLKYSPADQIGISKEEEPEDFYDIMRQRMENEYFLALSLRVLAKARPELGEGEVRERLTDVINLELYPKSMLDLDSSRLLLSNRSVLGVSKGPVVRPRYLETLRYNAFFFLAQSWKELGTKLAAEGKSQPAAAAFEKALQVYRTARDRLNLLDGPRIIYNMGEVMVSLNRPDEARRLFLMAVSQANQLENSGQPPDVLDDLRIWKTLSENRMKDLDNQLGG